MTISLDTLNHDILINIFTALSVPEILRLRQVSRQLYLISEGHAIWRAACTREILLSGIPFPKRSLISFSAKDLERQVIRAYKLGINWRSPNTKLHKVVSSQTEHGAIQEIKFLSRRGRIWVIMTCISIWWTLSVRDCDTLQEIASWSPEKALIHGIAVNTDADSDAAIAISVQRAGCMTAEILSISEDEAGDIRIQPQRTLDTPRKPIALNGDVVALCDNDSETLILNWKTEKQALLRSPDTWQDKPLHVVFVHGIIVVVRARSICVFEQPHMVLPGETLDTVLPRVFKSFGWVDGVSLALRPPELLCSTNSSESSLAILVRTKGDDLWRPSEQFQFVTLKTDLNCDTFHEATKLEDVLDSDPFGLVSVLSTLYHGPIRCRDMVVGPCGTAVWVQPRDRSAGGLITDNDFIEALNTEMVSGLSREALTVSLFPGLLNQGSPKARVKAMLENSGNDWSCLDYDEASGLIVLGSSSGEVTMYRL